jgi:hypothetical protein
MNIGTVYYNNNTNNTRFDRYHYCNNNNNNTSNQWHNQTGSMHTFEFFDYICVIDFEATCIESGFVDFPHEIIEFPIVLINMKTMQIVSLMFFNLI